MKAKPFKQSSSTAYPTPVYNQIVSDALAKHAESLPEKPPVLIAPIPIIPRVRKFKDRPRKRRSI